MDMLTVVTLNTWKCDGDYPARLQPMISGLAALSPDLVLLQEAFRTDDGAADTAGLLAGRLGMEVDYRPARRKPRRFAGTERISESGLAVLSRHPLGPGRSVGLPSDPADGERIAQIVTVRAPGRTLFVLNLHLTHLPEADGLRREQCRLALAAMDAETGGAVAIVGGDFNAGPDDPAVRSLAGRPGALDAGRAAGHPSTLADGGRCVDHLCVLPRPGIRCVLHRGARVLDRPDADGRLPSDHYGLMARFAVESL